MAENIVIVGTYPPSACGLATFDANLATYIGKITAEVGSKIVAPIDEEGLSFYAPVNPDLVIEKWNPQSWIRAACNIGKIACEKDSPTTVTLSHEYGLDPDLKKGPDKGRCVGNNFLNLASIISEIGKRMPINNKVLLIPIFHTIPPEPNNHQKKTIQNISEKSNGVIVMTKVARNFLISDVYGIDSTKVDYINHGVRVHDISKINQEKNRGLYGVKNRFVLTVTGLMSPAKGIIEVIQGFAESKKSLQKKISKTALLNIAGGFHPSFISAEGGKYFKEYWDEIKKVIKETKLKYFCTDKIDEFINLDKKDYDIIHLDKYLPENKLKQIYAISNVFLANHTDMGQMHSGTVPEAMGAFIPQITTKFYNALEMLADISTKEAVPYKGKIIGLDVYKNQTAGLLIDPGQDSINQIAKCINYLIKNPKEVEFMSRRARSKARMMTWDNTALEYIKHIADIRARL